MNLPDTSLCDLRLRVKVGKVFEGEMLTERRKANRMLEKKLLQFFCEIILNFQVIVKGIRNPDDKS